MGRTSKREPLKKFWIPFLVDASCALSALEPVVFWRDPAVRNLNIGPLDRTIEVRMGESTSSACFMVGAVVIWCVVVVSTLRK